MKATLRLLILLTIFLFSCTSGPTPVGTLAGQVSVGPLVPVVREGEEEPTPAPEVFAAREIVVFKPDGETEITRLRLDNQGRFETELPTGTYIVDINHLGIDHAKGFPKEIELEAGQTIWLDVDIDTGIR